jgi:hypothetical protein
MTLKAFNGGYRVALYSTPIGLSIAIEGLLSVFWAFGKS